MEASRRQPGTLEGLSRFLVQHERCGAGFDVAHPAGLGSGRVSITCRGCGARHEYTTTTLEFEREFRIEPAPPRPRPARVIHPPSEPARAAVERPSNAGAASAGSPQAEEVGAGAARRAWAATLAILLIAAAAGFAVVRLAGSGGGGGEAKQARTAPARPPSALPAPTIAPTQPATPSGQPPTPVPLPPPAVTTLRTPHFVVQAPRGWTRQATAGGLLLAPPQHGRVSVQIYFARSPALGAARMAHQTARFLVAEVPGGRLSPGRVRLGSQAAYQLTARGPGETAIAVNVLRGPYRYLLVRRIFAGAKPQSARTAGRIVTSFRPL